MLSHSDVPRFPIRDTGLELPRRWIHPMSQLNDFFGGPFRPCGVSEGWSKWSTGWERQYEVKYPRASPPKLLAYVRETARTHRLEVLDGDGVGRSFGRENISVLGNVYAVRVGIRFKTVSLKEIHGFLRELPPSGRFDRYRALITDAAEVSSLHYRRDAHIEEVDLSLNGRDSPKAYWSTKATEVGIPLSVDYDRSPTSEWSYQWSHNGYDARILASRVVQEAPGCAREVDEDEEDWDVIDDVDD